MQNVLKSKKYDFFSKSYVLDHSESIDIHIEKLLKKKKCRCPQKNNFFHSDGGHKVTDMSAIISFSILTHSLREDTHKKSGFFNGQTTKRGEGGNPPDH